MQGRNWPGGYKVAQLLFSGPYAVDFVNIEYIECARTLWRSRRIVEDVEAHVNDGEG